MNPVVAEVVLTVIKQLLDAYEQHKSGAMSAEDVLKLIPEIASNEAIADAAGKAAIAARPPAKSG